MSNSNKPLLLKLLHDFSSWFHYYTSAYSLSWNCFLFASTQMAWKLNRNFSLVVLINPRRSLLWILAEASPHCWNRKSIAQNIGLSSIIYNYSNRQSWELWTTAWCQQHTQWVNHEQCVGHDVVVWYGQHVMECVTSWKDFSIVSCFFFSRAVC